MWLAQVQCLLPVVALPAQRSFAPEALPSFLAPTISCASPKASHQLRFVSSLVSLRSLDHPLLVFRTFPTLRPTNLSLDAWTYTPAASGVHSPVSSSRASAFSHAAAGRRSATFRATTSARVPISGLQSFLYVQASRFACHPGRSYRRNLVRHVAAVASTSEHRASCCLLTRRIC